MYAFDETRLDLAAEFRANPFGEHSLELEYLLTLMRQPTGDPFHVLLVDVPWKRWRLATIISGFPYLCKTNIVFDSIEEAEWYVFKLRWDKLAGKEAPLLSAHTDAEPQEGK